MTLMGLVGFVLVFVGFLPLCACNFHSVAEKNSPVKNCTQHSQAFPSSHSHAYFSPSYSTKALFIQLNFQIVSQEHQTPQELGKKTTKSWFPPGLSLATTIQILSDVKLKLNSRLTEAILQWRIRMIKSTKLATALPFMEVMNAYCTVCIS